jgi:hypothetical protein
MIEMIARIFFMVYFGISSLWTTTPEVQGQCQQWNATMLVHGLDPEVFSPIMWRESRCKSWAHNDTDPYDGSFGLLQINSIHLDDMRLHPDKWGTVARCHVHTTGDLLIGWRNICFASHLMERSGGLKPWAM